MSTKGILQKPKYVTTLPTKPATTAAVVSPSPKKVLPLCDPPPEPIPENYLETIMEGFGENPDLYKDVLKVFPHANERQLRIAYFRRGREILGEGGVRGLDEVATVGDGLPMRVQQRFQAVSMAYEIISNPIWREQYDRYKWQPISPDFSNTEVENRDAESVDSNDPVAGSTASLPATTRSVTTTGSRSIRWKPHVEEMLFERQPEEILVPYVPKHKRSKQQKQKARIVIENSKELDRHLEKLDKDAEQHFAADFWDTIEESLDGLIRMATEDTDEDVVDKDKPSSFENNQKTTAGKKQPSPPKQPAVVSPRKGKGSPERPFDEIMEHDSTIHDSDHQSYLDSFAESLFECPMSEPGSPDHKRAPELMASLDLAIPVLATPRGKGSDARDPLTPSPFRPITPNSKSSTGSRNSRRSKSADSSDTFDIESMSFGEAMNPFVTPISPLSRGAASEPPKDTPEEKKSEEDEDIFEGLLDEDDTPRQIELRKLSQSPDSCTVVSDISERTKSVHGRLTPGLAAVDEIDSEDVAMLHLDDLKSVKSHHNDEFLDHMEDNCTDFCESSIGLLTSLVESGHRQLLEASEGVESNNEKANEKATNNKAAEELSGDTGGFIEAFIAYITAIVTECAETNWEDRILEAVTINEVHVDALTKVLDHELKQAPEMDAVGDVLESPAYLAIETARSFS